GAALRPARCLPRPRTVRRQARRRDPAADRRAGPGEGPPGAGRAPRPPRAVPRSRSTPRGAPRGTGSNRTGAGMSVRLALIGAGRMGAHHARVISQSPGVALDVVIDR